MSTREKIGLFVVGVLGCTLALQYFNKGKTFKGPAQISYQGDTIVVKQKGKKDFKEFQPDPKSTVITTDSHGHVTIHVRQFGVGFQPGLGMSYSDRLRVDLDTRVVYFKRMGLAVGLACIGGSGVALVDIVKPYTAVSYTPFNRFQNTSIFVGIQLDKSPIAGLRVAF